MDATTETRLQHKRRLTEFLDSDVREAQRYRCER
jgi:hypothetical protein